MTIITMMDKGWLSESNSLILIVWLKKFPEKHIYQKVHTYMYFLT